MRSRMAMAPAALGLAMAAATPSDALARTPTLLQAQEAVNAPAAPTAEAKPAESKTEVTTHADGLRMIKAGDLAQWMAAPRKALHVFDANSEDTRKKEGMIPGAVALPSAARYDVARTLPKDKMARLVFYCANEKCMASHEAAKRAIAAGYQDVYVMSDGVEGWKTAGQTTTRL